MWPVLFELGSFRVHSFSVTLSLAFLVAGAVMQRDFARKGEPQDLAWTIVGFGLVGGLFGARLHQGLYHWEAFSADPLGFLTGQSGLIWYGGLLGGVAATAWPIRRAGVSFACAADTAALGLAIGLAIGRLGCHLAGDGDWGTPTTLPWAVAYTHATVPWPHPPGVAVHPAPLYELVALVLIFALLLHLRARLEPAGAVFATYLALAGAARFAVEFVRVNPPVLLGLSEAQCISLALCAAAGLWLRRYARLQPASAVPGAL